jgi:hypothetical protein
VTAPAWVVAGALALVDGRGPAARVRIPPVRQSGRLVVWLEGRSYSVDVERLEPAGEQLELLQVAREDLAGGAAAFGRRGARR